jgi:hypothetical protein
MRTDALKLAAAFLVGLIVVLAWQQLVGPRCIY